MRFFALADLALLVLALVILAWLRVVRVKPDDAIMRRLFAAAGVLSLAYAVGLAVRNLIHRRDAVARPGGGPSAGWWCR